MHSPNVGNQYNFVGSVSCVVGPTCTAAGIGLIDTSKTTNVASSFIGSWSGAAWAFNTDIYSGTESNSLVSVACTDSANPCLAVGATSTPSTVDTLTAIGTGLDWSIDPSSTLNVMQYSELEGVGCQSEKDCYAVGNQSSTKSSSSALIGHWNGNTWSLVPSPTNGFQSPQELSSVSCTHVLGGCTAVGYAFSDGAPVPLIETDAPPTPVQG